jgi:hypothetical protein
VGNFLMGVVFGILYVGVIAGPNRASLDRPIPNGLVRRMGWGARRGITYIAQALASFKGRLWPLLIAHFLIDAAVFVLYPFAYPVLHAWGVV